MARTRAPAGVGWNGQGHFKIFAHGSEAGRACGSAIVYGACAWRANHIPVFLHNMAGWYAAGMTDWHTEQALESCSSCLWFSIFGESRDALLQNPHMTQECSRCKCDDKLSAFCSSEHCGHAHSGPYHCSICSRSLATSRGLSLQKRQSFFSCSLRRWPSYCSAGMTFLPAMHLMYCSYGNLCAPSSVGVVRRGRNPGVVSNHGRWH